MYEHYEDPMDALLSAALEVYAHHEPGPDGCALSRAAGHIAPTALACPTRPPMRF